MQKPQSIRRQLTLRCSPLLIGLASAVTAGACTSSDGAGDDPSGSFPGGGTSLPQTPAGVGAADQQRTSCAPAGAAGGPAGTPFDPYAIRTCDIPGVSHTIPTVPDAIALPPGLSLLGGYRGIGTVFLQCAPATSPDGTSDMDGPGQWGLRADKVSAATLYGDDCTIVGTLDFLSGLMRGARFTWVDGSQVNGGRTNPGVLPDGVTAGLPWILQPRSSSTESGFLSQVQYIHRVDTVGGVDPENPCDPAAYPNGVLLPFEATYFFYAAATTSDAGSPDAGE